MGARGEHRVNHLALLPDEEPETNLRDLHPQQLARGQAFDARDFMERVRAGGGLRFPWPDMDRMVGPMLPGWLIAVGGRAKAGKTTMLMELLTAWTSLGRTVVYVGTETEVALLRYVWGAVRMNVPIETALEPRCPTEIYERIMHDVEVTQVEHGHATKAIFADAPAATVHELVRWVEYGMDYKADALIFDHLSRLEVGAGERWQGLAQAIRQIKNLAKSAQVTVVVGAQLTQGQGGSVLGEHEVPGNGSWAGSSEVQREVDVGVQLWRPFKPGITTAQKQEAREDITKAGDLVQPGVMGVRLAAHRWGKDANQFCRLVVKDGQISSYSGRVL
jgi:KaiC/GvpD/RAD55 family RecA-like ATPase